MNQIWFDDVSIGDARLLVRWWNANHTDRYFTRRMRINGRRRAQVIRQHKDGYGGTHQPQS